MLNAWLRSKATTSALFDQGKETRFTHARIDELMQNKMLADKGTKYAKSLYLNLSTLSPYVSGPNYVKIATPLNTLEKQDIKIDKAYLVSCTNSRASDIAAAAKVFKDASASDQPAKIAPGVQLYIAAASLPEQEAAEEAGDWQTLLDAGAKPLPSVVGLVLVSELASWNPATWASVRVIETSRKPRCKGIPCIPRGRRCICIEGKDCRTRVV